MPTCSVETVSTAATAAAPLHVRGRPHGRPGEARPMTCIKRHSRLTLAALAATVLLSGCGAQGSGEGNAPEPVSIAIGEPMAPPVPGTPPREYGAQILQSLWTGLVEGKADGEVSYTGVAECLSSPDNVARTIRRPAGWTCGRWT